MFVRAVYIVYIEMLYSIVVLLKVSQVVVELTPTLTLSTMWRVLTPSSTVVGRATGSCAQRVARYLA